MIAYFGIARSCLPRTLVSGTTTISQEVDKGNIVKRAILAPLCSAFVLPGVGQIINQQIVKGIAMMAAATLIFLVLLLKLFLDFSRVVGQVMGPDLTLGSDKWPLILAGLRAQNLTVLWVLLALGGVLWLYSIIDAYWYGRGSSMETGEI